MRVWDLGTRRSVQAFKGGFHQLRGIAYTPDGGRIVFGAGDGTLCVLDAATHKEARRIEGQQAIFSALAIDASGRRCWRVPTTARWAFGTSRPVEDRDFEGHARSVGGVAFGPGETTVVSGGADRTVRVWDVTTQALTHAFVGHSGSVRSVAVPPGEASVFSASGDRTVRCWHVEPSNRRAEHLDRHRRHRVFCRHLRRRPAHGVGVAVRPDPFASSSAQVWDATRDRLESALEGHTKPIQALRMTADGRRALTASRDRTLRVWDLDTGRTLHVLNGHWDGVAAAAMTPAGDRAVSLSLDRTVRLWDLEQGRALRVLVGPDAPAAILCARARWP